MSQNKKLYAYFAMLLVVCSYFFFVSTKITGKPLIKEYDLTGQEIVITITFHPSQGAIRNVWNQTNSHFDFDTKHLSAFANMFPEEKRCDVHTLTVRGQNDTKRIETLGHEILHCLYGRWHPGNETLSNTSNEIND